MIISIDGPAGSGKSTVAELLSKKLNFIHFNSGSLYRGITAYCLKHCKDKNFENFLKNEKITLKIEFISNNQHVFVNNKDFTKVLRENSVSVNTPKISIIPYVRNLVDNCQKEFCSKRNVVIDGRDIGSFVFPNADIKFYLDCDIHERAKRRYMEENKKNTKISIIEIEKQIRMRDELDKNKKIAPLIVPKNSIVIDSTNLTINQVVEEMLKFIKF